MSWNVAIECLCRRFAHDGHLMNRAICEIDDFLGMPQRPSGVCSICSVARVRCGRCITLKNSQTKRAVVNLAGEAAVALAAKFSIPTADGQPHFDLDIGVRAWLGIREDSAKCGETLVEARIARKPWGRVCRRGKCSLRDGLCCGDLGVRQRKLRQLLSGLACRSRTGNQGTAHQKRDHHKFSHVKLLVFVVNRLSGPHILTETRLLIYRGVSRSARSRKSVSGPLSPLRRAATPRNHFCPALWHRPAP